MGERPPLPEHESNVFAAELGDCPELDVHGATTVEAEMEIERFLFQEFRRGTKVVKIIHGKGSLILLDHLRKLLPKHPLVEYARLSEKPNEYDAATYAVLKKKPSST